RPPFVGRNVVGAHVDPAEIDLPKKPSFEIIGVDTLRPEPRHHNSPVGGRSRVGVGGFYMTLLERFALVGRFFPDNFPAAFVDRIKHPTLLRAILRRVTIAIQAGAETCFRITADGGGQKDPVSPNHRARMCESGNWRLPENVLARFAVPF